MESNQSTTEDTPSKYFGRCFCGGFQFSVCRDTVPIKPLYCHCESCRRAHAAPVYQIVYIPSEDFHIEVGEELVKEFSKSEVSPIRAFCSVCGSRLFNRLPLQPDFGVGFFPALLDDSIQHNLPPKFMPIVHYLSNEAVFPLCNLADSLPRHES